MPTTRRAVEKWHASDATSQLTDAVAVADWLDNDWLFQRAKLATLFAAGVDQVGDEFQTPVITPHRDMLLTLLDSGVACFAPCTTNLPEEIEQIVDANPTMRSALHAYDLRFGHVPLGQAGGMASLIQAWEARHGVPAALWDDVWSWVQGRDSPRAVYHACSVFFAMPGRIPAGKREDLWTRAQGVLAPMFEDAAPAEDEPWHLRQILAQHYLDHIRTQLAGGSGEAIAAMVLWLAENSAVGYGQDADACRTAREALQRTTLPRSQFLWDLARPSTTESALLDALAFRAEWFWARALIGTIEASRFDLSTAPLRLAQHLARCVAGAFCSQAMAGGVFAFKRPEFSLRSVLAHHDPGSADETMAEHAVFFDIDPLLEEWSTLRTKPPARAKSSRKLDEVLTVAQHIVRLAATQPRHWAAAWRELGQLGDLAPVLFQTSSSLHAWCTILRACPLPEEALASELPERLADIAFAQRDDQSCRIAFMHTILASLHANVVRPIQRLLARPESFSEIARRTRTMLDEAYVVAPAWLKARIRTVLVVLPPSRLTADEQERDLGVHERRNWPGGKTTHSAQSEPTIDDPGNAVAAVWPLTVTSWQLAGRAIPTYTRADAPGKVWRSGERPPEHERA